MGRCELSSKELSRAEVMGRVKAGNLRLREAGELLELSYRQAKRIWARYRKGGAKALQHGNCGRHSNRAYGEGFRRAVLEQVRSRYEDFGPTLAAEHLASEEGIEVHAETLRRWMREAGLWRRARRRQPYRSWRTAWRNLTKAAGLKGLRFHDLRHQAITELAERSQGDQTIMSIAGHVSPEMLNHYSHIRLESKRRALETLEEPLLVASESQDNGAAPRPN